MSDFYNLSYFLRAAWIVDGCYVIRHNEFTDVNIQQRKHLIYHGHLEKSETACIRTRAPGSWQVSTRYMFYV